MTDTAGGPDFRLLFEKAPNLYLVLDPALDIVAVNDAYCQATSTKRHEIVGRNIFSVFPDNPADPTADGVHNLRASLNRVLRYRVDDAMPMQKYDIPLPEAHGQFEERYWSPLNSPVLGLHGNVDWIIHRVEDVTEFVRIRQEGVSSEAIISQLRQTNTALAARNIENERLRKEVEDHLERQRGLLVERAWLRSMVDHVPDYLFVKDREGRIIVANRAMTDDLGQGDLSRVIGKTDFDLHDQEHAFEYSTHLMEVLRTGVPLIDHDEVMVLPDGRVRLSSTTKVPLRDAKGEIVGIVGIARDVTARRHAEEASAASEAMARQLLDASPDTMLVLDGQGTIITANQQAATMYGYELDELVGRPMSTLVPARLLRDYAERLRDFADEQGGEIGADEDFFAVRCDGTEFPVDVRVRPHQTAAGPTVIVSVRDITERKVIEQQLRQAQKMEAIGSLTGGLAHDFNNLLSVIIGNLDMAREQISHDQQATQMLEQALAAALRGADLTSRLLAFARRQPLQPILLDLDEVVENTTQLLSRTLPGNIVVTHKRGGVTWPVLADPAQLEAAIINIMTNARDAMPNGGEVIVVTGQRELDEDYTSTRAGLKPGPYSTIEITDTGSGMSPAVLARIFEPFFTTKAEGRGTGLGLSMVFGFMKQSGGHVEAYSELGIGTTFRLYLPRAAGEVSANVPPTRSNATNQRPTETILTVEDNPDLRALVVRQLTQLGYRCLEAADGPSAIRLIETEPIDVLFSDVIMPGGMSGYDLHAWVRANRPQIRVLLTSGFPEEKIAGQFASITQIDVKLLSKPYRKEDLADALQSLLAASDEAVAWKV